MKRHMVAGYWIEAQTTHVLPHVTVERMGQRGERGYLTPTEARQMAEALTRAADAAENAS
jgi:hypothetical protein